MKRILFWLTLMSLLIPFSSSFAQSTNPVSDDEVNRLAEELYCPVCENVPLDVCPTRACAQWRELIREKIALGWSDRQIKDFFAAQYGDQVLAVPPRKGINWAIYILPPLILAAGIVVVLRVNRRSRQSVVPPQTAAEQTRSVTPEDYINQVENDLREYE